MAQVLGQRQQFEVAAFLALQATSVLTQDFGSRQSPATLVAHAQGGLTQQISELLACPVPRWAWEQAFAPRAQKTQRATFSFLPLLGHHAWKMTLISLRLCCIYGSR